MRHASCHRNILAACRMPPNVALLVLLLALLLLFNATMVRAHK